MPQHAAKTWLCVITLVLSVDAAGQVVSDGSLGQAGAVTPGGGYTYDITPAYGRQVGANLFHSFSDFSIRGGESANFSGPNSVARVISRVTGGRASDINGTLSSTISGADVYLVNPAGILFAPDAQLDVQGSFHATTADHIDLADGGRFDASEPANSVLTSAPPTAFGFLGDHPAPITLNQSSLTVPKGKTISLVGGDIKITGRADTGGTATSSLSAESGQINIVSVASAGKVVRSKTAGSEDLHPESFGRLGKIDIDRPSGQGNPSLVTTGDPGGKVFIRGGKLTIAGGGIESTTTGVTDHPGVGVDIGVEGEAQLLGTEVDMEIASYSESAGKAGDIQISADDLQVRGGDTTSAFVISRAFGAGDGGSTRIMAKTVRFEQGAWIQNATFGEGAAGNVILRTEDLLISGESSFAFISTGTFGQGDAGDIDIAARDVVLKGGAGFTGVSAQVNTEAQGSPSAGEVRLTSENLQVLQGAQISANNLAGGDGGTIEIDASDLVVRDAWIQAYTGNGDGAGGSIDIEADSISIEGVYDEDYALGRDAGIFVGNGGSGAGGSLTLKASDLLITDRAYVQTDGRGSGASGDISIAAKRIDVRNNSVITASGRWGAGEADAGMIDITTERLSVTGLESAEFPFNRDGTGIIAIVKDGDGGQVNIVATDSVTLTRGASFGSSSFGKGDAGEFRVTTGSLDVLDGSAILNSAFGSGRGGDIIIDADRVKVSGVYKDPITDTLDRPSMVPSGIAAQSGKQGGDAGSIRVNAGSMEVLDGGLVSTTTFGAGQGGRIELNTDQLVVAGENAALRAFWIDQGSGSDDLRARSIISSSSASDVLATDATGDAGLVAISTNDLIVRDKGVIRSGTTGPGRGGTIQISALKVRLSGDARILARSQAFVPNPGDAGDIRITALEDFTSQNSSVSARVEGRNAGGKAGNIEVTAQNLVLEGSSISSTVTGGSKDAGSVTLNVEELQAMRSSLSSSSVDTARGDAGAVRVQGMGGEGTVARRVTWTGQGPEGSLRTTAVHGAGGSIHVSAEEIVLTDALVSATVSGDKPGGEVTLRAPSMNLAATEVSAETRGAGRAGRVQLEAGSLVATNGSRVSSRSTATGPAAGDGGAVSIRGLSSPAQSIALRSGSALETSAVDGDGGDIEIWTRDLFMADRARIAAESEGTGAAGDIDIRFTDNFLMDDSTVSTDSRLSDGGDIDIEGGYMLLLRDHSAITTSVGTGEGTGGNIHIRSRFVVLDSSAILANAFGGPGGNIFIFADAFVPSADSIVEAIGKQSQIQGRIQIQAPDTDFIQSLAPLPGEFEDPRTQLSDRCGERRDLDQSSFATAVRDGLPLGPEAYLLGMGLGSGMVEHQGDVYGSEPLEAEGLQVDTRLVADANLIPTGCD